MKRILSILLCITMCISMFSVNILAEDSAESEAQNDELLVSADPEEPGFCDDAADTISGVEVTEESETAPVRDEIEETEQPVPEEKLPESEEPSEYADSESFLEDCEESEEEPPIEGGSLDVEDAAHDETPAQESSEEIVDVSAGDPTEEGSQESQEKLDMPEDEENAEEDEETPVAPQSDYKKVYLTVGEIKTLSVGGSFEHFTGTEAESTNKSVVKITRVDETGCVIKAVGQGKAIVKLFIGQRDSIGHRWVDSWYWEVNVSEPGYTVSYDANGGNGAPAAQKKIEGEALTLSSTLPRRAGYIFQGWATSSYATTAQYQPGGKYTLDEDVTLYAVWKFDHYVIYYDANGGSGAPSSQNKNKGQAVTLSTVKPLREGYIFQGWATGSSATSAQYQPGARFTEDRFVTLYAVWKFDHYIIRFNANGGTDAPSSMKKYPDISLTLTSEKPTRQGYGFLGWAASSSATSAQYQPGDSFSENKNLTLYAVWEVLQISSISLSPSEVKLDRDEKQQLTATVIPSDALDKSFVWQSSDEEIASVSNDGLVIGKMPGTAIISAKAKNGVSGECRVTVKVKSSRLVPIDETRFPDSNFRTFLLETIDSDKNGYLGDREIERSSTINCSGCGIESLTGIRWFTNLVKLNCSENNLTSLDVSMCTSLEWLICSENKLTSLSLNDSLKRLYCDHNSLTALQLNAQLEELSLNANDFYSLDFSGNSVLRELTGVACRNLTSLNLSGCSSLKTVGFEACGSLTWLNVSNCSKLAELRCYGALTTLNLSGCTSLTSLDCSSGKLKSLNLKDCPSLRYLNCGFNELTTLDLSNCLYLEELDCGYNKLTGLHIPGSKLKRLDFANNSISAIDLSPFIDLYYLESQRNCLASLDIGSNPKLVELYRNGSRTVSSYDGISYTGTVDGKNGKLQVDKTTVINTFHSFDILRQPVDIESDDNVQVSFSILAAGNELTYQWYVKEPPADWRICEMDGASSNTLSFVAQLQHDGWRFRCEITDGDGNKETSDEVCLSVNHRHIEGEWKFENVISPTCETDGERDHVLRCAVCGEILQSYHWTDSSLGHRWGKWNVELEPTCSGEGIEVRVCSRNSDHAEAREIEKLAHTPGPAVKGNETEATCETGGGYDEVIRCTVCGEVVSSEHVVTTAALGHDWSDWAVSKIATCKEQGVETRVCRRNSSHVEERFLDLIPHQTELRGQRDATAEEDGYTGDLYCRVCGELLEKGEIISELDWAKMPDMLVMDREYVLFSSTVGTVQLNTNLTDGPLPRLIEWRTESGGSGVITVDRGMVTACGAGTDYVIATLTHGDVTISARCRVDVLDENEQPVSEIVNARLPLTKFTVELLRTDYTRIPVILELKQNLTAQASADMNDGGDGDGGVTIRTAEFAVGGKTDIRNAFHLRVADDRNLEIIPNDVSDAAVNAAAGSYRSAILLTLSDGRQITTSEVMFTVKKSKPKLTTKPVTVNSFITGQTVPLEITGGRLSSIQPKDLGFATLNQNLTVTVKDGYTRSSTANVTLTVQPEDWAVPAALKITVKNQYKAPKIALKPTSVTLNRSVSDTAVVPATVTPLDGMNHMISASGASGLNAWYDEAAESVMVNVGSAGPGNYTVSVKADGKPVATLRVKVMDGAPGITARASGTINPNLKNSPVLITVAGQNINAASQVFKVEIDGTESSEQFRATQKGNVISITAGTTTPADGKHTAVISCRAGGNTLTTKPVSFTVKAAKVQAPSATLKATGNIDILRGTGQIIVTPTIKNKYDFDESKLGLDLPAGLTYNYRNGHFVVTAIPGANINPNAKSATLTLNSSAFPGARAVSLQLKQGKATVLQSTKAVTLSKIDRYDRELVFLSLGDSTLQGIRDVKLIDAKGAVELVKLGYGEYGIQYVGNKLPGSVTGGKLKSTTVKLDVFLQGNGGSKPNATLSVKVNFA
ncbi:MAG: InlB B-repeat-containing protein [Oscillospiraceae bacterium]|nr:InlB B-repeat-containing protein [Oscillospiraceae bacterium]